MINCFHLQSIVRLLSSTGESTQAPSSLRTIYNHSGIRSNSLALPLTSVSHPFTSHESSPERAESSRNFEVLMLKLRLEKRERDGTMPWYYTIYTMQREKGTREFSRENSKSNRMTEYSLRVELGRKVQAQPETTLQEL